jgi:fatty-acid desaturase
MGVPPGLARADVQPVEHELRDRIITGLVTVVPMLALSVAAWRAWEGLLRPGDLVVLAILYVGTGLGVTVGFHRLFTHRSFKARPAIRAILAVLGSAAIEGPVISWVADHRQHHAFSDRLGDPHSPHVDHGVGWLGALRGLLHAHVGWLFRHDQRGARARYAPDLLADPVIRFVDRTFPIWAIAGLGFAFGLGAAIGGSVAAGLTALLWAARCGCSSCTTSRTASTRSAMSSGGEDSTPPTSLATCSGSRCPRSGRPGTTTTTRSRPPRVTASAAGSSIRRRWSSAVWRPAAWPGTSCA